MNIKQFEYKPLAHYSYAIESEGKVAIIDPERNPEQYYAFAKANNAEIVAVIETHPHADFVSSHLEIHKKTGATIYNSKNLGADYPHQSFDEGDDIQLGKITIKAINTPGHSPDSITVVATDANDTALFTGDTLFIGDVGRPDLREKTGNMKAKREELAEMMYETITHKFKGLPDDALVYPAHGAGSLCGKSMSDANSSTLGNERMGNWAFKEQSKQEFMDTILEGQLFIPSYFGYNVDINKDGAEVVETALEKIPFEDNATAQGLIIDMRDESEFKNGHLEGSINIQATSDNAKFETWLGSIVEPEEEFILVIDTEGNKDKLLHRVAKIGYEKQLTKVITLSDKNLVKTEKLDLADFKENPNNYTIVDIRNNSEVNEGKFFKSALSHPLNELRNTAKEIPTDKPIVVHCAGGYRSAAGSSILEKQLKSVKVYDLSDDVKDFKN
ncbi:MULTISPECIES: rhodanese-like domain-containing protein [Flavobacteriaceae]|jgi:glyoxylase-like metal-dependent hydrolase (beta-lactamase superfamily II)/rhodanese-related sulfurtransferase|uniref:MBL fold metallo-hydrolase n=1 Tax=Flavobacteriaceae TaxID=49546 RepID=UPI002350EEC5|nr:rhodanese-like domain-containing protein [Altibacter sp. HG106]MDC7994190.1 rhodanese-like domain-containing protein [Altibacter sp. HG106]|tara:strand:+ start:1085 stop:2416 length:1332 start_codon:yes stop_codon:yes gene_type:complete